MEVLDCCLCNTRRRRRHYLLTRDVFEANPAIAQYIDGIDRQVHILFNNEEYVCRPCRQRAERAAASAAIVPMDVAVPAGTSPVPIEEQLPVPVPIEEQLPVPVPNVEQLPVPVPNEELLPAQPVQGNTLFVSEYSRPPNTANACIFYGCRNESRHRVPEVLKASFLIHFNYYVPLCVRVCQEHLDANAWDELFEAPNVSHNIDAAQFYDIMRIMKTAALANVQFDFENLDSIHPSVLQYRVGLTHYQFNQVLSKTPSLQNQRNSNTLLAMYLMKLRTGEPSQRLAQLFNTNRRSFERKMFLAQVCLTNDFVPQNIGWDHITREEIIGKNLTVPSGIYENNGRKAIIICDGTYITIQKSSNFFFQRKTYSHHKYHNLLKPFMLVTCDGHIIDVTGPHAATTSDASIMSLILNDESTAMHWVLKEDDLMILDRGFRDSIQTIESCGYQVAVPESVQRGETQLTTMQANKSRLVTLCRWVVEVVNGRFKRDFKIFKQNFFNRALTHMMVDFKIAAALINRFHVPVEDSQYASTFLEIISVRMNVNNILADYVIENNINRQRVAFRSISVERENVRFPLLTEEDLILFALGTYHIKLAYSYYSDHIRGGLYNIEICEQPNVEGLREYGIIEENILFLRARIQSRHIRARQYYTYVIHSTNEDHRGRDSILHYYCPCSSGKRTLGCCAHVMSVVWFLGWARRQDAIRMPAHFLDTIIIDDY